MVRIAPVLSQSQISAAFLKSIKLDPNLYYRSLTISNATEILHTIGSHND